ncbi:MAG: metal ABC transporter substrate-binding protein [Desulfatirhabdiaceae bacterium]
MKKIQSLMIAMVISVALTSYAFAKPVKIMASIYPVGDMIRQVGGELVDVTVVVPPGASPHTFELKPATIKTFSASRLFFMVGAGLEFWANAAVKASGKSIQTVVLSDDMPLIQMAGHLHDSDAEKVTKKPHHESANPHIWLDPILAKQMVGRIVQVLSAADPEHAIQFASRGEAYSKKLDDLDRSIKDSVRTFKIKKYVAFHPAWDYFALRYGLECDGVIEASPGRNPTPKMIAHIVKTIQASKIQAVFAEPQFNPQVADVIAREAGVRVLFLDPIGGSNVPGGQTYLDLMNRNMSIIREAMQ